MSNGLRDENGALIGGLVVLDYVQGIEDFEKGTAPPDDTSPSYDLGRQRAAEKLADKQELDARIRHDEKMRDQAMKELLPPNLYAEYRAQIDRIRNRPAKPSLTDLSP